LFGHDPATLVSAPVETLIPEHLRERHSADRAKYDFQSRIRPMGTGLDLVARRADGTTFPVDIMLSPLKHLAEPMVLAVVRDMTERQAAEQLLRREVNHRAKNILSVVQAMVQQTKASCCEECVSRLRERIQGLSASCDLLVKNEWQNASLVELVRGQLAHFGDVLDARIAAHGPDLRLKSAAAQRHEDRQAREQPMDKPCPGLQGEGLWRPGRNIGRGGSIPIDAARQCCH
jgi:PAS domain S-box-containing protein